MTMTINTLPTVLMQDCLKYMEPDPDNGEQLVCITVNVHKYYERMMARPPVTEPNGETVVDDRNVHVRDPLFEFEDHRDSQDNEHEAATDEIEKLDELNYFSACNNVCLDSYDLHDVDGDKSVSDCVSGTSVILANTPQREEMTTLTIGLHFIEDEEADNFSEIDVNPALEDMTLCTYPEPMLVDVLAPSTKHHQGRILDPDCPRNLYNCKDCSTHFSTRSTLYHHLKTSGHGVTYTCGKCSYSTKVKWNLTNHQRVHNEKKIACPHCSYRCRYEHLLKFHMVKHTGQRIPCPHANCYQSFIQRQSLNIHLKLHENRANYKCNLCLALFSTPSHRDTHMLTHSGARPFPCPICPKKFQRKHHLDNHVSSVHKNLRPHECGLCHQKFKRKCHLTAHQKRLVCKSDPERRDAI